jgi:hypothetical protein
MRDRMQELRATSGYAKHVGEIVERELAAAAAVSGTELRDMEAE